MANCKIGISVDDESLCNKHWSIADCKEKQCIFSSKKCLLTIENCTAIKKGQSVLENTCIESELLVLYYSYVVYNIAKCDWILENRPKVVTLGVAPTV